MSKKWILVIFCVKSHVQTGAKHSKTVWLCGPLTFQFLSSWGSRPKLPAPSPPNILTPAVKVWRLKPAQGTTIFLYSLMEFVEYASGCHFFLVYFLAALQQNWSYILVITVITQKQIRLDRHCKVIHFSFTFNELNRICWMICDMDFLDGDNWGRT